MILAVAIVVWLLLLSSVLGPSAETCRANREHELSPEPPIGPRAFEPASSRPLGFNWKIGIGLITSLAAREVIVGTLGTIYGMEGTDEHSASLQQALRHDLTPGGAAALLVFFAFAMQCMSTVAVVRRETGGWKWPAVQFAYMTIFAYVAALIANRAVTFWS